MKLLKINPRDNVAVALTALGKGESVKVEEAKKITALSHISPGHKMALRQIAKGDNVIKYGYPIGYATRDILPGETVHTHNLKTSLEGILEYSYNPQLCEHQPKEPKIFRGYRRPDGKVGIRNEVWIVPTVGCVNMVAKELREEAQKYISGSVDGLYAFPHPYGCSQLSDDHKNTRKALVGLINHPNAGAVLVLGLGCENNTIDGMKELLSDYDKERIRFLVCQDYQDEVEDGLKLLKDLITYAGKFKREDVPMSELIVGLKCGGSDGFSGITANPLVGAFTDRLIDEGGSAILTEVPEMFGAETILMNRCRNKDIFNKTVDMINEFKSYYIKNNQDIYENPSPGNKAGGISTLEDKSLGCIQKGGTSNIVDVLGYGEPVKEKGLSLLTGPGNDLVSASSMTASCAHLVLFTTGRGTPFGAPVPTVKISSNSNLFERKKNWIDFNAGSLLEGTPMDQLRDALYEHVIALASGEIQTKSEQRGAREFTIFKTGVTL